MSPTQRKLYLSAEALLLAAALAAAAISSRAEQWQPIALLPLLVALAIVGDWMVVVIRGQRLTSAFVAQMLAISLLGPAPAVALGLIVITINSARRRVNGETFLINSAVHSGYLVAGGLLLLAFGADVHDPSQGHFVRSVQFGLVTFLAFVATNFLNFILIALTDRVSYGRHVVSQFRQLYVPMLPGLAAASAMAAILCVAYTNLGYPALLGLVLILVIFQYLAVALLKSEERAEQLEARTIRLASLQLGVLATLVETLALRDPATARHAAAVARYARALARHTGASEAEQDLAHSAGLLHDIGKFALPDRILHASTLTELDRAIVRRHPQDGAALVGRLDGYGPVADAILYHHERVDGTGYPAGLIGREIPLLSRILAVCSVYDTLTARDSYRESITHQDAAAELRRSSGTQLDDELVEAFISMLEEHGPVTAIEGDNAQFETELAFEQRSRAIARAAA